MKTIVKYLLCLALLLTLGCSNQEKRSNVPYWETDEFWNAPMDSTALDSIMEGRKHIIADNGKPYPIDEYEMCIYRRGEPITPNVPLDSLIGTWHGYGHLYDPRTVLTINPDSTYSIIIEDCGDYDDNGNLTYTFAYEKRGNLRYNPAQNMLTFLKFNENEPASLTREAYMKSKNPIDEVRIIYSLDRDTMWIFDGHSDFFPYFRPWVSKEDMMKATH